MTRLDWLGGKRWLRLLMGGVCALTLTASAPMVNQPAAGTASSGLPWLSGSNASSNIASFANYRGSPLDVTTTWEDDGSWRGTESVWALNDSSLNGFAGKLSVAIPMLSNQSDSLSACAAGAYDSHFRALGGTLKQYNHPDAFVRLGWEGNGVGYAWSVGDDPTTWTACFRREVTALRSADPAVRVDWNMNKDGRVAAQLLYPGDDYVDVVGVDFYDMYPAYRAQADWDADYMRTQDGGPRGLGTWLAFAQTHGKPLSVPEWGVNSGGVGGGFDNPFYIQKMHDFFVANAGSIAYESYFNSQCPAFCISPAGVNPSASAKYRQLWRASASVPTLTPTPPQHPSQHGLGCGSSAVS